MVWHDNLLWMSYYSSHETENEMVVSFEAGTIE